MTEIADSGALGEIKHVLAEAYGPVVLRARKQNWRTRKIEGGGRETMPLHLPREAATTPKARAVA